MSKTKKIIKIAITTGDVDGIGLEVTLKALWALPISKSHFIYLYAPRTPHKRMRPLFDKVIKKYSQHLLLVAMSESPTLWVEDATKKCLSKDYSALVTAPLSKETIVAAGRSDIVHTDIFSRLSGRHPLHMAFIGPKFNVVLATSHIPISEISTTLTEQRLAQAYDAALGFKAFLPRQRRLKPLALVGLNPHAGENGLIGAEETTVFKKFFEKAKPRHLAGPLSPDAAFLPANWNKFSAYICCYHDQGLIPFKMIHGQDHGVHITLGLPFIRTSVDHGTAKDLFGKGLANPNSMKAAIALALQLSKGDPHAI